MTFTLTDISGARNKDKVMSDEVKKEPVDESNNKNRRSKKDSKILKAAVDYYGNIGQNDQFRLQC